MTPDLCRAETVISHGPYLRRAAALRHRQALIFAPPENSRGVSLELGS